MTTTKRESYVSPAVDGKTVSLIYTALDYALYQGNVANIAVDRVYGSFRVTTSAGHLVTLHAERDWEPFADRYIDSVKIAFFKNEALCVASAELDPDEFGVILATMMAFVNIPA
jgi:hypothetical protein